MKKYIEKIIIIALSLWIITSNIAMAIDFDKADQFITKGSEEQGISDLTTIGSEFTDIGNVLKYIGAGIIVAATGYIGIQYMISPPERQAKLKQQLIGLVVAGFVIFGGYYIWKIIVNLFKGIFGTI